ncbi:hypothetical protein LLEC1_00378 [Akanthomyces lecanii]|uniref:Nucleolar protein 16 n=1 Tax=Cordyceps confragosa TaxID=2714763 RepID=A0A179HZB6_CORDF|nr:hypothetical protein LLEC1_00378 [Akanthomyces lecanii]
MGRELQKKKRRSGRQPIRQSNKTKKILNPRGNNIIADNWDKKSTLSQNYRRLGLVSRLRAPTGGHEEWGGIVDARHDDGMTDVVRGLVEQARNPAPKRARHLSEREAEWLHKLVARHGDDTRAMARDARLNPMQQTAADIARRLKKLNG